MFTKLTIRNFKLFSKAEIELGERVVLIGPNNAGKSSALQALALWQVGLNRWVEKRGEGDVPEKRPGVTINRKDLIAVPVPAANLLWKDLHTQESAAEGGTKRINIQVIVEGVSPEKSWICGLEFYYGNEESFYCRPILQIGESHFEIPVEARSQKIAYLPPMSGLASTELRLDAGAINVRLGEGRTAEVLRNLCYEVLSQGDGQKWYILVRQMKTLFGITLEEPRYIKERGEIVMNFKNSRGIRLDISSGGRGQQQTLLLLAHMAANPGSILLLDEPDAHLEILRQRQIYQTLGDAAHETGSQIIAASHSEVVLNEAAERDVVVAFVGEPHRIDDRGSQVLKALRLIGFEQYYQAEETGWVLYLEGSTDLAILRAFAERLNHPVKAKLDRPFVHYVGNQPNKAREHFFGLKEGKPDLVGLAIYDRLGQPVPDEGQLRHYAWRRNELENYLCQKDTLLAFAEARGRDNKGDLFGVAWREAMERSISEIEAALATLGGPSPWDPDIKASDEFLDKLFKNFYSRLNLPNLMRKTNYYELAPFVPVTMIDSEISDIFDLIVRTADAAKPLMG